MVSALAVVALALGIGLSTLMFSILNGAVLRGLPFERSERILHASPFDIKENDDFEATQWEFAEWRTRQTSFEDLTAFYTGQRQCRRARRHARALSRRLDHRQYLPDAAHPAGAGP